MKYINFPNVGILEEKLSPECIKRLKKYIKASRKKANDELAGNITRSNHLIDKDNWFFNNVLNNFIEAYIQIFSKNAIPSVLTTDCKYSLNKFWVNFQKKHEFNPSHDHGGVFSFVIWIKIPASYKKEKELPFVKESNNPCPNTFSFVYANILGRTSYFRYLLEPEYEGTMLFFPSGLDHEVHPYYTSDKERISISGNISFNVDSPERTKDVI